MNKIIQWKQFTEKLPELLKNADTQTREKIFAIEKLYFELAQTEIEDSGYWGKIKEERSLWESIKVAPKKRFNLLSLIP